MSTNLTSLEADVAARVTQLDSELPVQREHARHALIEAGPAAVVPVLQELMHGTKQGRWEAAKILGEIGDPAAAGALAEQLDDEDGGIRWVAAEALASLGEQGLRQALMTLLSKSESIWVQKSAHHVVARFARQKTGDCFRRLLAAFRAFEPAVALPIAAFAALHELDAAC